MSCGHTQQSEYLSLCAAWPTSSIIPPPFMPTAVVITRLTRMVRVQQATPTHSSVAMATQVSVPPSSMWWETYCRASASWWQQPSSTFGSDIDHIHVRVRPKCQLEQKSTLCKSSYMMQVDLNYINYLLILVSIIFLFN